MKHFLKKNFLSIFGAGGGDKPDAPPPPTLNPPKLGALTSLTSYSYSESVDALGEGPIEGLVNQNGQYLSGHRIFEGIYIEDVPVKKTIDPLNQEIEKSSIDISSLIEGLTSPWIQNGIFVDRNLSSLPKERISYNSKRAVNDPYEAYKISVQNLSGEIIFGKRNIAKAIFKGIDYINQLVSDPNSLLADVEIAKQTQLQFSNLASFSMVENAMLRDFPTSTEYPFFCIKINLGNIYEKEELSPIDFTPVGKTTNFLLEHDISNQIFQRVEISELGKKRINRVPKSVNLAAVFDSDGLKLGGYIYIFGVHENGFPTKETIEKLRESVKKFHIINFNQEKYNYSNILAEIRNGEELQMPLSFFDKTYLDKNYGIKLLGPFSTYGSVLKLNNFAPNKTSDGIIPNLAESSADGSSTSAAIILTPEELNSVSAFYGLEEFLKKDGSSYPGVVRMMSFYNGKTSRNLTQSGGNFTCSVIFRNSSSDYWNVTVKKTSGVISIDLTGHSTRTKVNGDRVTDVTRYTLSNPYHLTQVQIKNFYTAGLILTSAIEGSNDSRIGKSFSDWSASSLSQLDEEPNPVVHVVRNPNVESVYLTVGVRALMDTAETNRALTGTNESVEAGSKIPSIVRFKVETGLQDSNGEELPATQTIIYQIVGIAETPALIDIGRTENSNNLPSYSRFIQGTSSAADPIVLPAPAEGSFRYVRITRTTYETYSSLVRREISLEKVTEIIPAKFSYPNTAIVGVKLDSRTLSSLPPRSYDARLKRIMVPSNYFPLRPDGSDKRYWKKTSEFFAAAQSEKIIYDGDWDGTFKESWSDNPAWILFDLLTNKRYGLGNFVSASQVNVWELYKIGRFCDAVNDSGYFEGVTDANGGLEPRYSCNVVIADKTNVFDVIKSITSTFRGNIFYLNSYIDFTDDRVKLPKYFFNNQNVRDGIFNYTNSRRDEQFNAIDVSYFDRNDGFKVKTEYIEDPEDIKKRGVLRTEIDTFGITSRAQANRIGKHIIYSTINENQAVSFSCGPEILSCRPGDLISVEDDLKTLEKNIGRVLDIDYTNKVLRLDEKIDAQKFLNEVTLFVPTGMRTYQDYYDKAVSPSKLAMSQLYANDVPQVATFYTTGYTNLDYGCNLYLDPTGQNISLLEKAVAGGIYSITLSGLKQEIYKVLSIREDSNLEYSVAAAKFDTGKFGQIESGQSLVDFYNSYPNVQSPTQGESSIQQNNVYQLSFPVIQQFNTGNYDLQNDSVDFSGSWSSVPGATHYDYELVTPKFRSITGRTTGLSATFTDQTEAGRFTFRVSARNENSIPNPISPICSSGITVLSFSAPIRSNSVFAGISVKNS